MPITTRTTWWPGALDNTNQLGVFFDKIEQMKAEGKTDGNWVEDAEPEGPVVVRTWTSLAAAQEWNVFVSMYNPTRTVIEET